MHLGRMTILVFLLPVLMLFQNCGDGDKSNKSDGQSSLSFDEALDRWNKTISESSAYKYVYTKECFCVEGQTQWEALVNLKTDSIVSLKKIEANGTKTARPVNEGVTVSDLFLLIHQANNLADSTIYVSFHAQGYPLVLKVNMNKKLPDGHVTYMIDSIDINAKLP